MRDLQRLGEVTTPAEVSRILYESGTFRGFRREKTEGGGNPANFAGMRLLPGGGSQAALPAKFSPTPHSGSVSGVPRR